MSNFFFLKNLSSKETKVERQPSRASSRNGGREAMDAQTDKRSEQSALPDARVRQLKDQLIRGKVYLSLSATRNNPHFIRELRLRMKEVQRALGDATKDSELPRK